jgi:hypothetical protein
LIIVSHEAEDAVEDAGKSLSEDAMDVAIYSGCRIVPVNWCTGIAVSLWPILNVVFCWCCSDVWQMVAQSLYHDGGHYTLLAIPFFSSSSVVIYVDGRYAADYCFAIGDWAWWLTLLAFWPVCCLRHCPFIACDRGGRRSIVTEGQVWLHQGDFAAGVICNAGTLGT